MPLANNAQRPPLAHNAQLPLSSDWKTLVQARIVGTINGSLRILETVLLYKGAVVVRFTIYGGVAAGQPATCEVLTKQGEWKELLHLYAGEMRNPQLAAPTVESAVDDALVADFITIYNQAGIVLAALAGKPLPAPQKGVAK